MSVTVLVNVKIDAKNSIVDARILYSSGRPDFDDAAISAALGSSYRSGVALCKSAPGEAVFRTEFSP